MATTLDHSCLDAPAAALRELGRNPADGEAWRALAESQGRAMWNQAWRVSGDATLAEDALQEALLQARRGAGRFQAPEHGDADAAAAAWLSRITRNCTLELLRRRDRAARREQRARDLRRPSDHADPDREEELQGLRRELAALPRDQREVICMHYLEGYDYRAIACALGCTAGAARVRAHRGLARLRERLQRVGLTLGVTAIVQRLAASAGGPPASPDFTALATLAPSTIPILPSAAIHGGMTMFTKIGIGSVAALALASSLVLPALRASEVTDILAEDDRSAETADVTDRASIAAEDAAGTLRGVVIDTRFRDGQIFVRVDGREYELLPRWVGGADGSLDETVLAAARELRPGADISIEWIREEGLRAVAIRAHSAGQDSGVAAGRILEIDREHGRVILDHPAGPRLFMPHWHGGMPADGGGLDEETIAAVAAVAVGDWVGIQWTWEERARIEAIRALSEAEVRRLREQRR